MDYGEAHFINSKFLNKQLLIVKSCRTVGLVYKFHKKSEKHYACSSCKSLGKSRIVTVSNDRIVGIKHPEDDHHADCKPVPEALINVTDIDRTMRADVRKTGKRPRDAYQEALTSVTKKFKSSSQQEGVVGNFPAFREIRRQLDRHRDATHIPVPDAYDIPEELRSTLRGKSVESEDVNYLERFLLYSGQGGKLLIFAADTELNILNDSEFIICDGTFEMAPTSAYQLYSLHGFFHEEAMPLVWALLPGKSNTIYAEMFAAIRQALLSRYGSNRQHVFLTDFELAAVDAIKATFPDSKVKGCTFHFRQALMRHVADEGLRAAYISRTPSEVRDWIRQIMGLTLLPEVFIPRAWTFLKHPPTVEDNTLKLKMESFSAYVEKTWILGQFPPVMWSHFDNIGPRTTNIAEGWHNSLNHSFRMPHPSSRNFMHWLQRCQYEVQCRKIQLQAGRAPKPRDPTYILLDERIAHAKLQFGLRSGSLFVGLFPQQELWNSLDREIFMYLRHASYLIAGQD